MSLKRILIFFCLFASLSIFSQSFQGGIAGGLNAARIDGDGHELYGKLGLNAGAFIAREILPRQLFWQMELKYTSRGKYNIQRDLSGFPIRIELIDLRYVELPVSLHYFFTEKFQIELGLSPDVLLKEYYEIDNDPVSPDYANDLRRFGVTAFIGANYFIMEKLALGMRFNYSAIPFYKFDGYAIRYRDSGFFHDVLSLNARYYITRR
jgi:hypothetical protein